MGRSPNHKRRVSTWALLLGLVLFQVQSFAASALVCLHQPAAVTRDAPGLLAGVCPYHGSTQSGSAPVGAATPNAALDATPDAALTETPAASPESPPGDGSSWSDCQKCRLAISAAGWHLLAPPVLSVPIAGDAVLSPTVASAFFRFVPELFTEPPITHFA